MAMQYPEQYCLFFERFNQGEYYECHDLLEEIWLEQKHNKECIEVLPPVDSISLVEVKNLSFPYINLYIREEE